MKNQVSFQIIKTSNHMTALLYLWKIQTHPQLLGMYMVLKRYLKKQVCHASDSIIINMYLNLKFLILDDFIKAKEILSKAEYRSDFESDSSTALKMRKVYAEKSISDSDELDENSDPISNNILQFPNPPGNYILKS